MAALKLTVSGVPILDDLKSSKSDNASSQWPPFPHALMAAFQLMPFGVLQILHLFFSKTFFKHIFEKVLKKCVLKNVFEQKR
jgi:hypothetical protein